VVDAGIVVPVDIAAKLAPSDRVSAEAVKDKALAWLRGQVPGYPFDGLEELASVDVPSEIVPPGKGEVLDELFPPNNLLQIRVERRFVGDQLQGYRLCASGLVGVAAIGDPISGLPVATVMVEPKVPGASLLTMLSYAFVPEMSSEQRAQIDVKDTSIASLLVLMYLHRLKQMVEEHGLQRSYIGLEEELRGTVRSHPILATYLGRHVPAGQSHIVPCRFWELRIDSEPNRALRWGLEVCRMVADRLLSPRLVEHVENIWDGLAHHFSEVLVVPYQSSQVRRLPRSGRFTPYESTFELLEFLLDHLSFELIRGQVCVRGFAVEMWKVFERFVINILKAHMRGQVQGPQVPFRYTIRSQEGTLHTQSIYLDGLIEGQRRLVLDAKWKTGITVGTEQNNQDEDMAQIEGLNIRNADLFQVVAYSRHYQVQAAGSILVYPVLETSAVCKHRCILDFMEAGKSDRPFPVFLVGMPVGDTLDQSLDDFVALVREISLGPTELETTR